MYKRQQQNLGFFTQGASLIQIGFDLGGAGIQQGADLGRNLLSQQNGHEQQELSLIHI